METNTDKNPLVRGRPHRRASYTPGEVTRRVQKVLQPIPAKVLARAAGSSVRGAENAKQGLNAPSLAHFLNACREIPELRALALEMMGCETTIDPDFIRGFALLQNSFSKHSGKGKA